MNKITFENLPSTNTPVNATNLNQMQDNIEDAINNTVTYTITDTIGWKRIAQFNDIVCGDLQIINHPSNGTILNLTCGIIRGYGVQLIKNMYNYTNQKFFTKARVVYKGNETVAYLELYQNIAETKTFKIKATNIMNVSLYSQAMAGSVPSGYSTFEIPLDTQDYTQATGTYTTGAWTTGTNTCTWTAPRTGLYILWARFDCETSAKSKVYKQLQLVGTATRINGDLLIYQDGGTSSTSADSNYQAIHIFEGCKLVYAQQGQTIIPYIHTPEAGIVWNIRFTGLFLK